MAEDRQIALIPPGEGPSYWLAGDRVSVKLAGKETLGAFEVFEIAVAPQGGPPPHVHSREDETFYILEGEFEFLAGNRTVRAAPGTVINGVRGIPHTFKNVGAATGRIVMVVAPPRFEAFAREAGQPVTDPASPPPPRDRRRSRS